jgi:NADP-dependent 3-hydroxy acid dehydrogenase YdfG
VDHLKGKVVLVTGAASGFGREIATQAAARGATAIALDVDAPGALEVASAITGAGGSALGLGVDVRSRGAVTAAAAEVIGQYGRIDVLINNAGVMPLAYLADHARAADAWDRCIDINLKGTLHGIYAVYDHMAERGGHIVNISSVYGNAGVAGAAVYGATKAAIATLSDALRVEGNGRIKVTLVRPSGVPGTNLGAGVLDFSAPAPLAGHRAAQWQQNVVRYSQGILAKEEQDAEHPRYWTLTPAQVAEQIVNVIDQPLGVAITELTLRATGEDYVF